jgi:hypothetical protein
MMLRVRSSWSLPSDQVFRCDIIHQTLPFQIRVLPKYGWGYCNTVLRYPSDTPNQSGVYTGRPNIVS